MSALSQLLLDPDPSATISALSCVAALAAACGGYVLILFLRSRASRRTSEAAHSASGQGSILVNRRGAVLQTNGPAHKLLWPDLGPDDTVILHDPISALLSDDEEQHHLLRLDSGRLVELSISSVEAASRFYGVRGIAVRDVTEQRQGERHLVQLAHYDSLTGLGNRRLFIDRLECAIIRARRARSQIALLYIDLDRFKNVNDTLGHGAGDELLKTLANRFRNYAASLPDAEPGAEIMVSRLAGDEFAIIVPDLKNLAQAEAYAQDVLAIITEPMTVSSHSLSSSGSVGIALFPDHANDVEDLVKHADSALYVAKDLGRARFVFYEASFGAEADRSHVIDQELRKALDRNEFILHYQPKVDLVTKTVAGFEALLRWSNSVLGFVGPKEFIPVAEDRGMIVKIGTWCIRETCRQISIWKDAGYTVVPVSVNVSSAQFRDSNVQTIVADALVEFSVDPHLIEIELTESLLLEDDERTDLALREIRAMGVGVALDDFGTGYSALTYLNRFPLDVVKMDRGFLRDIEDSDAAAGIAAAVISMSHSLGFKVVAEGVDSPIQAQLLEAMSCDQIQGFLFSPAIPGPDATQYLAGENSDAPVIKPVIEASPVGRGEIDSDEFASAQSMDAFGADQEEDYLDEEMCSGLERSPIRVLVVDLPDTKIGVAALRLTHLRVDIHLASGLAEAREYIRDQEPAIDLLLAPPESDLQEIGILFEELNKLNIGSEAKLLFVGSEPTPERRSRLREAGAEWILGEPYGDPELRFFINSARSSRDWKNKRQTVRVPIETMAWVRTGGERGAGVLTSLSRRGAFIETRDAYEIGQPIRVEFKIDSNPISVFANVARVVQHDTEERSSPPGLDVIFYEVDELTDATISEAVERLWTRYRP